MTPAPEVTVVIATRDREERLAFALDALARQKLAPERFEVVVVRGAGARGPFAAAPDGLAVRFLESGSGSPAAQRNEGWRAGSAPLVAFTDDDCRPDPGWLESLLAAADGDALVVQGRTEPEPRERPLLYGHARSIEITGPTPWAETCNIAYPRALLERLGGFDEGFPRAWGEDTDLALRAHEAGARVEYADGALVHHAVVSRSLADAVRDAARFDALGILLARHPEHREALPAPWLAKRSHGLLLLALAGAVVARRRPALGAIAAAPYALATLRAHLAATPASPRSLLRFALHAPGVVAVELAELVATVRGALANRVLLV